MVEVCKASGVNFVVMCTHTVDMAMATLVKDRAITTTAGATYNKGDYFKLSDADRELVNEMVEDITIATRLLSLLSNKKLSASKQELRNDHQEC